MTTHFCRLGSKTLTTHQLKTYHQMWLIRSHWHQKLNGFIEDSEWPLKACNPVWCGGDPGQSSSRTNQSVEAISASVGAPDERTHRAKTWRNNCECTTSSSSSQRSTSGQWSSGRGRCAWWMSDKWQSTGITWIFLLHLLTALDIPWPADVLKTIQSRQRQLYMDKNSTVVSVMPCAKWSFVTWRSLVWSVAVNELGSQT